MEEREFELINIIGIGLRSSQRDLSRQMNLSLGLTNMLLRRLVTKGYIRIQHLNKKKLQYILTPKGFTEKMRKSVKYTMNTINSISLVKQGIAALLKLFYDAGERRFYLFGGADLVGLIEMTACEQFAGGAVCVRVEDGRFLPDGILLICRERARAEGWPASRVVNVIEELAKDQGLISHALALPLEPLGLPVFEEGCDAICKV